MRSVVGFRERCHARIAGCIRPCRLHYYSRVTSATVVETDSVQVDRFQKGARACDARNVVPTCTGSLSRRVAKIDEDRRRAIDASLRGDISAAVRKEAVLQQTLQL